MRSDMAKVIVERPRLGSGAPSRKKGYRKYIERTELENLPQREPLLGRWRGRGRWLNEHLGPMRRFLRSQVGRPWNKVHQELCEHVSFDNSVQKHVLTHVFDFVQQHVELVGEAVWSSPDFGWSRRLAPGQMYICPRSGLLKVVSEPRRKPPVVRVNVGTCLLLLRRDNAWWEVRLREYLAFSDQWDVWFDSLADRIAPARRRAAYGDQLVAVSMRALDRQETRDVYKRLRTAPQAK